MASSSRDRWSSETQSWQTETDSEEQVDPLDNDVLDRPLDTQQLLDKEFHAASPAKAMRPVILILLAAAVIVGIYFALTRLGGPSAPPVFQDLGAGVSNADGLRGDLSTRWEGGRAQYKLTFSALNSDMHGPEFSYVAAHPPYPISFHIRVLDATGYALCSKDIVFPSNPARVEVSALPFPELVPKAASSDSAAAAAQQQTAKAGDVFQDQVNEDGKITAMTAQGSLPCSANQYKQASYWDFSTNFPTVAEQTALMNAPIIAAQRAAAAKEAAQRRKLAREYHSAFFTTGDATVSDYNSSSSVLWATSGQSFRVIRKSDSAIADTWAADGAQIHFKCDQYATCQLTGAGSTGGIYAKSLK